MGCRRLNGFIGESPSWAASTRFPWPGILGGSGIALGAAYLLWLFQRTMLAS